MIKKIILTLWIGIVAVFTTFANRPDFRIRFYNKEIYYTNSAVQIKIEIYNNTNETIFLKAAEDYLFNLNFNVVTVQNLPLKPSESYLIKKNSQVPYQFRVLSLEPGEEYGFIINLEDFVDIAEPGLYVVEGLYFPFMDSVTDEKWMSNKLTLSVLPRWQEPSDDILEEMTMQEIQKAKLPPDEVVAYTIQSRQNDEWMKFFLYLDVVSLMLQNDRTERIYQNSTQEEQFALVQRYKEDLENNVKDKDGDGIIDQDRAIVETPYKFEVVKTTYDKEEARVVVMEYFDRVSYTEIKKYTYYLHKKENIWKIYRYDVVNQGNVGK